MKLLFSCLAVAAGGALGSVARLLVSTLCGKWLGTAFPIGTFIINITGSLFLGWFLTVAGRSAGVSDTMRIMIAVGFVGAYTTFSTFMFESNALVEGGLGIKATINLIGSVVVGLLAVRIGIWLGRA